MRHLGLALGGGPAASFAARLMVAVSNDTLLRVVRRRTRTPKHALSVVGIDDFAWRRNHRYGAIVCGLQRRRTVTLLPDREPATSQAWLRAHPSIVILTRDCGGGYGEAAAKALPDAEQVGDRWHLMANASEAFLDAVRKSMRSIRAVIGAAVINPDLLTLPNACNWKVICAARKLTARTWRCLRMALFKDGAPIKQIVNSAGLARATMPRIVRGQRSDVFRTRQSTLDAELPWLDAQWDGGQRNASALWRAMQARGFRISLRAVSEWAAHRRAEKAGAGPGGVVEDHLRYQLRQR